MSKMQYAQEYLAEFISDFTQYFPMSLIKKCCNFMEWKFKDDYSVKYKYYLGVDVARFGGDENAFCIVQLVSKDKLRLVKVLTTSRISLSDTIGRILKLNELFNFNRIFIDDMGVGAGVTDVLIDRLGRKVIGINNSSRPVDRDKKRTKKILKEDLYSNLLVMMEQGKIDMIDIPELKRSLASIHFEYTEQQNLRIHGKYSHITEALVRAAWSIRTKGLKLFAY